MKNAIIQEQYKFWSFIVNFQTSAYGNVNYDPAYSNYYDYSLVIHMYFS